ncbi:Mss4-like protein [Trichoderma compactum]
MTDKRWETQLPYQEPDRNFDKVLEGACHCGRVKYWLSKDKPLASKYCHCGDCKVIHGAPFQWAAIFQKSDVAFQKGAESLRFYNSGLQSPEHKLPCKVSCSHCGTLIMDEGRNMVLLFPTLLSFQNEAQKKNFAVQYVISWDFGLNTTSNIACMCHLFYPQRVVDLPDGKPKWAGLDNKSELVDEV